MLETFGNQLIGQNERNSISFYSYIHSYNLTFGSNVISNGVEGTLHLIMMAQQGRPNMEKKNGTIIRSRTRGGVCSCISN